MSDVQDAKNAIYQLSVENPELAEKLGLDLSPPRISA
jgi:hypothetical protein